MTEHSAPAPAASSAPDPKGTAPSQAAARPPKPPLALRLRRWGKRLGIAAVVLVLLLVIARFAIVALFPWIVDLKARRYGFTVHWDRFDVSILRGNFVLSNLVVEALEGETEPVLKVDYIHVDALPFPLLRKTMRFRRLDLDGVSLELDREENGVLAILETVARARGKRPERVETKPRGGTMRLLRALSETNMALVVEALRVQHVRVHFRDASVIPDLDARLDADVRVSDFAFNAKPPRPTRLEVALTCPPVLESFRAEGEWDAVGERATGAFRVALERFHAQPLSGYLTPLGIEPEASEISGKGQLKCSWLPPLEEERGHEVSLALEGCRLDGDGKEILALDRLTVEAPAVSLNKVHVAHVDVQGGRVQGRRALDGSVMALGLRARPPFEQIASLVSGSKTGSGSGSATAETGEQEKAPFIFELGELAVRGMSAKFQDEAVNPPTSLAFSVDEVSVKGVKKDPGAPHAQSTLSARFSAPGVVESIAFVGTALPFAPRHEFALHVALDGIGLKAIGPYLAQANLESALERGKLGLDLSASVERSATGSYKGALALTSVEYEDGSELAGVDAVIAKGVTFEPTRRAISAGLVEVAGPRLWARREASRAKVLGGIRLVKETDLAPKVKKALRTSLELAQEIAGLPGKAPRVRIDRLWVHDVRGSWDDESAREPVHLALADAGVEVLGFKGDVSSAPGAEPPAKIRGWIQAPGIAENVLITGTLDASPLAPRLDLAATVDDLTLKAAAPYLAEQGITSDLEHGELEARLHARARVGRTGSVEATAALERLSLRDLRPSGDREILLLENARAEGVRFLPRPQAPERIQIDRLVLGRLRGEAALETGNALRALGLTIAKAPPSGEGERRARPAPEEKRATAPEPFPAEPGAEEAPLPVLEVSKVEVDEVALDLHDRSHPEAIDLPLRAGLALGPVAVDLSGRTEPEPGPLEAWLKAPGTIEGVSFVGTLALSGKEAHLAAHLETSGIKGGALTGRLEAIGIEPILRAGRFGFDLSADARLAPDHVAAEVAFENLAFEDAGVELMGVDSVRVHGIELSLPGSRESTQGKLVLGEIEVKRPRGRARRETFDTVVAGGMRFHASGKVPPRPAEEEEELPEIPWLPRLGSRESEPRERERPGAPLPAPFVVELGKLRVEKAQATLEDDVVSPRLELEPTTDLSLEGLVWGHEAEPARIDIETTVPGALESFTLKGTFAPGPTTRAGVVDLEARGIDGSRLAPYMGSRGTVTLRDGSFHARISGFMAPALEGGERARLVVSDVAYRDGESGTPLFSLDAIRLLASRIDPRGGHVLLDEISVNGVQMDVERTENGGARFLGIELAPPPREVAGVAPVTSAAPAPATEPAPVEKKRVKRNLPLVELSKLAIGVRRLGITDRARPGGEPITVSRFLVKNVKKIEVLGPDPASEPPLELELTTEIAPVASRVQVSFRVSPFALEPELALDLAISGLSGAGVVSTTPELADKLDGTPLRDGRVKAHLSVELRTGRRDPVDFEAFTKGFGGEVFLRGVDMREGESGPTLAGFEELHLEVLRVDPRKGSVHVRALELSKPVGLVTHQADGLHVLGFVVKEQPKEAAPEAAPKAPAKSKGEELAAPEWSKIGATLAREAKYDVRVDRVSLADMAFLYRDDTVKPPALVPLTGLDVDMRGFTTRAFTEHRTIRFDARVRAGKVPLPKREKPSQIEERPLFDELGIKGELALVPFPIGQVRSHVEGLELADFAGLAAERGVELKDGIVDFDSEVFLTDKADLRSKTDVLLNSLDVSESENGVIKQKLALPTGLNTAVFALRDEEGTIELALPIELERWIRLTHKELRTRITDAALHALGVLILNAVESAPLRVVTVGGTEKRREEEPPVPLEFAPGDAALGEKTRLAIRAIAKRLRQDEDRLLTLNLGPETGGGDLAQARITANPSSTDRRDLIVRLRSQRDSLERERRDDLAEMRAGLAAGLEEYSAAKRLRVQAIDGELVRVERGLDQLYDLERPGVERQAERRARIACSELAARRVEAVRWALAAQGVPFDDDRVHVARGHVGDVTGDEGGRVVMIVRTKRTK